MEPISSSSPTTTEHIVVLALLGDDEHSDAPPSEALSSPQHTDDTQLAVSSVPQDISQSPPNTGLLQRVDNDSASISSAKSIYWSIRSRFSVSTASFFTFSTGRQSEDGSIWRQSLSLTTNSGFGPSGAPRSMGVKGVRQGREKGVGLPRQLGVGRTGKGPAAVPTGMLKALGVIKEHEEKTAVQKIEKLQAQYSEACEKLATYEKASAARSKRSETMQTLLSDIRARLGALKEILAGDEESYDEHASALAAILVDFSKMTSKIEDAWVEVEGAARILGEDMPLGALDFPPLPYTFRSSTLWRVGFRRPVNDKRLPYKADQVKVFETLYDNFIKDRELQWKRELEELDSLTTSILVHAEIPRGSADAMERYYRMVVLQSPRWTSKVLLINHEAQSLCNKLKAALGPEMEGSLRRAAFIPADQCTESADWWPPSQSGRTTLTPVPGFYWARSTHSSSEVRIAVGELEPVYIGRPDVATVDH